MNVICNQTKSIVQALKQTLFAQHTTGW